MSSSWGVKLPYRLRKIHIMLVDNDRRMLHLMARVMHSLGFGHVIEAEDGYKAVLALQKHDVDLVITDWDLSNFNPHGIDNVPDNPVMHSEQWLEYPPDSGAGLAKYIRRSKYSPNPYVPIIMLIGLGLQNHVEYARDSGVNEILLKPFSVENLCRRMIAIIASSRTFVLAESYKGPCRRIEQKEYPAEGERRKYDVKVIKHAS